MKKGKQRVLSLFLSLVTVVQMAAVSPAAFAAEPEEDESQTITLQGSGTKDDPYQIADAEDLAAAVEAINQGGDYEAACYQLTDDIQLDRTVASVESFSGVFDGGGHVIDGYTLKSSDETDGLFRLNNGTIRALGMTNVKVTGPNTAETSRRGGLCFQNKGTIEECFVTGSVSGGHRTGGIAAENYELIQNCYFTGKTTGRCETGGIAAWNANTGTVKNCYVSADITTQTNNCGIIGGYGYTGTVYQGNVILSGSTLTTTNDWNHARICGRNNGENTTFLNNLSCEDVTINGATVSDGAADNKQGLDKTAQELMREETYTDIGWDFDSVWTMDETLGRPVLQACREQAAAGSGEDPAEDRQTFTVESPDGSITATVFVSENGNLGYSVQKDGTDVLLRASLGLTVNGQDLGRDVTLGEPVETTLDETYETRGMHPQARNYYNQSTFLVSKTDGNQTMTLNFRVYDDGIAVQYQMPEGSVTISGDDTRFALPTDAKAFFQYGDNADGSESYEGIRNMQGVTTTSTVSGIQEGRLLCCLPTFQLKSKAAYVCITEANLYDWSGMGLRAEENGILHAEYWDKSGKTFTTESASPWRVAIIADNLTDFVNSDMVTNVSAPEDTSLFTDKSYIQPGRAVWTTQGGGASTVESYKEYSKCASQLGIEYNLIEARDGFGDTLDEQFKAIKEIVDYSAKLKNPVKIWIWEDAPTTRYEGGLYTEENAKDFLRRCKDAGVVGVKIDHIHSEAPDKVSFYHDFTKLAAEYGIMVSYHNPMKPTGLSRTYPNEMTREAIRGLQYKTDPNENAILPFTRLLAGGADYTPLNFSNSSKLGAASWTHMLANTVIMTSSYLQLSENPKNLLDKVYTDFIKEVPTVWDETTVLEQSEIGTAAAYLRRSGDDWYLAVQNADQGKQTMTFALDFLGEGDWYADIYCDNMNVAASVKRKVEKVTAKDSLTAEIRSGGGYVVRLTQTPISYEPEEDKTYEIHTAEDLDLIRQHPDASFTLKTDLTLSGVFQPIPELNGTLDGAGHTISGLTVSATDASAALILQNNGTVKNLGLTDVQMDGPYTPDNSWRAALCIKNYGTIEQCYALGTVKGGHRNGGLVSENYSTIENCYFLGDLESNWETGGITSFNYNGSATVQNCYAGGNYVSRMNNMGFISGYAYGGTRMTGNVALYGGIKGTDNLARICGRNNGVDENTTYQKNLACADITVNGQTVSGGAANNKNGADKTAAELKNQATYEALGWDFSNVWTMDEVLGRPVLKAVAEKTVQREINTADTLWRYLDDGTDPAVGASNRTAWTLPGVDDSAWKTGKGSFGAKKGEIKDLGGGCTPNTLLSQYKTDGTDKEAFFFRTTVTVDDPTEVKAITGSILYDDAAIVYLNGQRIAAFDADSITGNLQYGGSNAADPKTGEIHVTDSAILKCLRAGENTVAVELHQGRSNSSDIYMDMTAMHFEKAVKVVQNSISLNPGSNESQMNFTWYANVPEAGTLWIAKADQLVNGAMPADAETVTATAAQANKSGFYSNQCIVTGLEPDTRYAYQLVNGEKTSEIYTFKTAKSGAFKFLFAGDPQLGASGNVTNDKNGWAKTLKAAVEKVPDAAFLLSAGDQVNTNNDEAQYSAYLEQAQLYSLPVATVVGNHDSGSNSYDQHFNVPNESDKGKTNASADYWFRYGNTLFLVLNVNNMSTAEHKAFMEDAISKNTDAAWKVVAMHHSVYSVANHATEDDILQRRNGLVPVFKDLDIDVVLQGHDHVYVRSYMMDGLTPVTDAVKYDTAEKNSVTDTDDILYITANSASGSKYYTIQNREFPYAAVKSQERTPTYSEVSVSDTQFQITTYRTNDGSVLDEFTINRTAQETGHTVTFNKDEHAMVDVYNTQDYTTASATNVTSAVARNSKTGAVDITGDGQVNFKVNVAEGYEIASVTADTNFKNLKDLGNGMYRLTKVIGPVAVTITTKKTSSTKPEEPTYTPVVTDDTRVQGFYNGDAALKLELAGRYNSGAMNEDGGSLEIVQYNASNGFAYAVSGVKGKLIAVNLNGSMDGDKAVALSGTEYDIKSMVNAEGFTYGDMTSVAVSPDGSKLAVAIQAENYAEQGLAALFACNQNGTLTLLGTAKTGVQPDMVTFADNSTVLTADEGEPRLGTAGEDPKGSVTIVTIGESNALTTNTVTFDTFDSQRETLAKSGVLLQKGTNPSVDFEPEYIAVSGGKAYVSLQEANAIAVLDIATKTFTGVYPLGFQNYSVTKVDLEKNDKAELKNYTNVYGIKMPDGISVTTIGGKTYLLTANEGDSRSDWEGMNNESEGKTSPTGNVTLGSEVVWFNAAMWDGLDQSKAYIFGGRSFSLYEATDSGLTLVYDSGSDFETITSEKLAKYFNCSNNKTGMDNRSGKKGPEPETVTTGTVDGKTYAFIALERIGGVMVYDITDPAGGKFVNYINSREFDAAIQGDVSPEGLCFASAANGRKAMLLAACEVSGTLAAYELTPAQNSTSGGGSSSGGHHSGGSSSGSSSGSKPSQTIPEQNETAVTFADVKKNSYYFDAVAWAVKKGVTNGKDNGLFGSNDPCTRAQIVTFLWRAAGSPEPKTAVSLTDVPADAYYAKAVAWAIENGITLGTTAATFSPNAPCTRAQAVTFLYRAVKTFASGTPTFSDVPTNAYYAAPVVWAVENGITNGTDTEHFSPNNICTRAQIVTFLYRTYQG